MHRIHPSSSQMRGVNECRELGHRTQCLKESSRTSGSFWKESMASARWRSLVSLSMRSQRICSPTTMLICLPKQPQGKSRLHAGWGQCCISTGAKVLGMSAKSMTRPLIAPISYSAGTHTLFVQRCSIHGQHLLVVPQQQHLFAVVAVHQREQKVERGVHLTTQRNGV